MPSTWFVLFALLAVAGASLLVRFRRRDEAAAAVDDFDATLTLARRLGNRYNNLLSAVLGHASLLDERADEQQRASLRAIEEAVREATELTASLMAFAGGHPGEELCDLADYLRTITAVLRLQFDDGCRVDLAVPDGPVPVAVGRDVLRRVVHDICAIGARTRSVVGVTLTVTDGDRPTLEAAFKAIDPGSIAEDIAALPSVRRLLAKDGVAFVAERSVVRLHLPSLPSVVAAPSRNESTERTAEAESSSILVVDDDESLLGLSEAFLVRAGYEVLKAVDGAQAVETFAREHGRVAAIVLDLVMPVMNGREAFLHLKRIREDVPIVLCTGYDVSSVRHLEKLGFAGFLRKPFTKHSMTEEVGRVIAEARRAA